MAGVNKVILVGNLGADPKLNNEQGDNERIMFVKGALSLLEK